MKIIFWIPFIFWILINLTNVFDAVGDAFNKKNKWILSKTFQMLMILSLCAMIPLVQWADFKILEEWNWARFIGMFILIRIGIFNVTWAMVKFGRVNKKVYWYYLGRTSLWDQFLEGIITKMGFPQKHFLFWLYLISWLISIGLLINGFYLIK